MGILASVIIGFSTSLFFAMILYWLDRYEKEPILLLGGVFTWGAVVAAGTAFLINTVLGVGVYIFTNDEAATEFTTASFIAPIVEESLKGIAVLLVFIVFYREFDSILDGIIYAGITALGFAATENSYYIYTMGYAKDGWAGFFALSFVRIILVGWQHPFYTAFIGIGLAVARLNRHILIRLAAPVAGWFLAVSAHALHNTIAGLLSGIIGLVIGTILDWTGWFFMLVFIIWAIYRERKWIVNNLEEEVRLGTITSKQYLTACSAWSQSIARFSAITKGHYKKTNRFLKKCAELSFKKEQLKLVGEERGNTKIIETLRAELAQLSPEVTF
jgi:protease PrsW